MGIWPMLPTLSFIVLLDYMVSFRDVQKALNPEASTTAASTEAFLQPCTTDAILLPLRSEWPPVWGHLCEDRLYLDVCSLERASMYLSNDRATWLCSAATLKFMDAGSDLATVNFKAS